LEHESPRRSSRELASLFFDGVFVALLIVCRNKIVSVDGYPLFGSAGGAATGCGDPGFRAPWDGSGPARWVGARI